MSMASRPLRIAFYSPRASHLDLDLARGGDPIFLHALFDALRARGHEVRVASRLNVHDLWRGRLPLHSFVKEAVAVWREMRRFAPDGWLVYNPSRSYPDLLGWWQRPRRYVLFGAHTWQSARMPGRWRRPLAFAFRRCLRRADKVIATRPATAGRLSRMGVPAERLAVVPHAPRGWSDLPSREDARRRLGLPQGASVALCVSRFAGEEERKQLKTETVLDLVGCVEALPSDVVVVVAGDGPGRKRVEEAAARAPADRIRLLGPVANDELEWLYAACDFYAYPNPLDRPWLTVLEAQACGRPVVTMRTGSAEVTVDEGGTGLLADDLDEFRDHITTLATNRELCASMGAAARAYFARNHSIEVRAEALERWLAR
jgi:glycosyltransferase involved in cell wall biosynthesis